MLGVTQVTIRRDLQQLEQEDRIRVLHGVAAPFETSGRATGTYRIREAEVHNIEAKREIAAYAASLIREKEIVYLDPGSTTELVARFTDPELSITVVTTALNISDYVANNTNWVLVNPGGTLHRGPMMFEGSATVDFLKRTRAHRAFISASGVAIDLGVTCTNLFEVQVKQAAIQSAREAVLVADHSKFGAVQMAHFADIGDFDVVVTDSQVDQEMIEYLNSRNLKLVLVEQRGDWHE
jgi:DeoR family transcriptional regulator, deoxyribose operon repressor